jgi:ATP-binding cassette subfamily C protein
MGLALLVGVLETIGAFLIFGLLSLVMGADQQVPFLMDLRERFSEASDERFLLGYAITVTVFFVLRGGVFLVQIYTQNRLAHNAGVRLSARLLAGYLKMPYSSHLRTNSAELIRNVNHSVLQIVLFAFVPLVILGSEILLGFGLILALVIASPLTTGALVLFVSPLVVFLILGLRRGMGRLGQINEEMNKVVLQSLQEGLGSVRDIKLLGRSAFFEQRFATGRARLARAQYLRTTLAEVPRVLMETMLVVVILVFIAVATGTGRGVREALPTLGLFGYAGVRLLPSVNRIVASANNLQFAGPAVSQIHSQLRAFEEADHADREEPVVTFDRELVVKDVSFGYDTHTVLDGISLTVKKGEAVGLVGPTGAGKSTLIDVMLALLSPMDGEVTVDGVSVHQSPARWQSMIGMVPQSVILIDDSIRRNVAFGLSDEEIDDEAIDDALVTAGLDDFVAELPRKLDTVVGERGVRLSGGQRQRIAIARALYRKPRLLIFDEATSALDNVTEGQVIDRLRHRQDVTLLMIAHRLTTLRHCDKIIVLEDGRAVDEGTYESLVARNALFQAHQV